jgi:23S rRNA (cytosine1962-C5)-methyltransferase
MMTPRAGLRANDDPAGHQSLYAAALPVRQDGEMSPSVRKTEPDGYRLIDAGGGRRLERFGRRTVDRPAPTATDPPRDPAAWRSADLRYEPEVGWSGGARFDGEALDPWPVQIEGLTLEIRPTSSGGVGLYPEHLANVAWLTTSVAERAGPSGRSPAVLHLFAHTGLLTLAAARAGAAVAHVDAARTAVAWARRNAELSALADRPIRWLVDDATAFVAREARRGRRYDGIVLDPPSFGRAGRRHWRLEDELPDLLAGCAAILAQGGFVLLTAHTAGVGGPELEALVRATFPAPGRVAATRLTLDGVSGARLALGWSVRVVAR